MDFNKPLQNNQDAQPKPQLEMSNILFNGKSSEFGIQLHDQNYKPFNPNSKEGPSKTTEVNNVVLFLLGYYDELVPAQQSNANVKYGSSPFLYQTDPIKFNKYITRIDENGKYSNTTEQVDFDTYRNLKAKRLDLKDLTRYRKTLIGYLVGIDAKPVDFGNTNPFNLTTPLVKFSTKGINLNRIFESGSQLGTNYLLIKNDRTEVNTKNGIYYGLNYQSSRLTEDYITPNQSKLSSWANIKLGNEYGLQITDPDFVQKIGSKLDPFNDKVQKYIKELTTVDTMMPTNFETSQPQYQQSPQQNQYHQDDSINPNWVGYQSTQNDPFAGFSAQNQQSAPPQIAINATQPQNHQQGQQRDFPGQNDDLPF